MPLPQVLSLSVSRQLVALLFVGHAGALASVLFAGCDSRVAVIATMVIFASMLWQWQKLRGTQRIGRLILHADGSLELVRDNGVSEAASVHPHSTVTPFLAVLLLKTTHRLERLVVLPDALGQEDFRMLRLWLRWRAQRSFLSPMPGA